MSVSPAEARKARAFLYSHHKHGFHIPPRKFAAAAKESDTGFRELLKFIGQLSMGGQGESTFRVEALRNLTEKPDAQS